MAATLSLLSPVTAERASPGPALEDPKVRDIVVTAVRRPSGA